MDNKPDTQRALVTLIHLHHFSAAEAARRLDIAEKTARNWVKADWYSAECQALDSGEKAPFDVDLWSREIAKRQELIITGALAGLDAVKNSIKAVAADQSLTEPQRSKALGELSKAELNFQEAHRRETKEEHEEKREIAKAGKAEASSSLNFALFYASLTPDQKTQIALADPRTLQPSAPIIVPD